MPLFRCQCDPIECQYISEEMEDILFKNLTVYRVQKDFSYNVVYF